MALSMMTQKGDKNWQTVKPKADDKKRREEKKKQQQADPKRDRLGVAETNVFAAIDQQYQASKASKQTPEDNTPYVGAFTGLDVEATTLHEEPETPNTPPAVDASGKVSPSGSLNDQPLAKKAAKPKAPKKPKVTLQQVSDGIDVSAVSAQISELQAKYPDEHLAQVMMLGDVLLKLYREADLPFNNILQDNPLKQAAKVPLIAVPPALASAVEAFIRGVPPAVLPRALLELLASVVEGLPDSHKAKSATPPRAKVGILILLAVLLRTAPAALLEAAPQLLAAGRTFTAGPRLLHLLWAFHQAAITSELTALAVWVRVLLPQLLGLDLSAPAPAGGKPAAGSKADAAPAAAAPPAPGSTLDAAAQDAALDYAASLLGSPDLAALVQQGGAADLTSQAGPTAAVPATAVEGIARTCFAEGTGAGVRQQTRSRLAWQLYTPLAVLAGSSEEERQHAAWVPLALETAGTVSTGGFQEVAGDEAVARAATSVLSGLLRSDGAFAVWEVKHKGSIKGSCRVLQYLALPAAQQAPQARTLLDALLADPRKRERLAQLLAALRQRHSFYLQQGKGWQGAAARAADSAVASLQRRAASRRRGGPRASGAAHAAALALAAAGTLGVVVALAAHHNAAVSAVVGAHLGPRYERDVADALQRLQAVLEPYTAPAIAAAGPHVARATEAAAPYVQQAAAAAAPYYHQAVAAASPYAQQVAAAAVPLAQQAQAAAVLYARKAAVAVGPAAATAQQGLAQVSAAAAPYVQQARELLAALAKGAGGSK